MTWWPGWNSIESVGWWSGFYFWFGIVCLFLLAISEVVSHRYGLRKDELVTAAERNRAAEQQRKEDAAEARRKAEVAALQETLAQERASRLLPRSIEPELQAAIVTCLKTGPKGPVFVRPALFDAEAKVFSDQIEAVLREAEFEIRQWPQGTISWSVPGAFLIVKDVYNLPPHASAIQNCFEASGILLRRHADREHPDDAVSIGIGAKP